MLLELIALSREPSSKKRREVLQQVSKLFAEGADSFSSRETLLFGDIFTRLLDQVSVADRVAVSERVAHIDQTPRDVVMKLANDAASVAAPILEFSTVLSDSDLRQLANEQSQDHLLAISRRSILPEIVTDVIVKRGEDRVLASVAANQGAQFSETGLVALAERASQSHALGEILWQRCDLPSAVVNQIWPVLSDASRARFHYLVEHDVGQAKALFDRATAEMESARKYIHRERIDIRYIVADIRQGKRTLNDALAQLIRERRVADLAHVLAEFAGLPIAQVANVLLKADSTGVAAVCKSLDVPCALYEELSAFRCSKLKLSQANVEQFGREYVALDKATAERTIRFHKVRQGVA